MGRRAPRSPPLGIVLDAAASGALHEQIGEQLRSAILERRLAPGARLPSSRLMAAVESVFSQYRQTIDDQHAEANRILHVALESPRPQVRLRFVDAGVEMVFRYPVVLQKASQIEDQITRKLLEAISQEPKLKMVSSGTPRIQSAA